MNQCYILYNEMLTHNLCQKFALCTDRLMIYNLQSKLGNFSIVYINVVISLTPNFNDDEYFMFNMSYLGK